MNYNIHVLRIICLIVFVFLPVVARQGSNRWTPDLMIKQKRVGGTTMSSDGRFVAYAISTPMIEGEKSEFVSQVWVASVDGNSNVQFTFADKSSSNPTFSPDGKHLAFTSSRGPDSKSEVWIMRVGGGEAEQVTKAKAGVSSYRWSSDGKKIAYTMTDPESEQEEKEKKEKRDWQIVDTNYKNAHLYTVTVEKDSKVERKTQRLTGGAFHVSSFDWSPDGKTIVFSHQINPTVDVWPTTDISSVPSDSGAVRSLVSWKGSDSFPQYSPDGKWIAFSSDKGDPQWPGFNDLYVMSASGSQPRKLSETEDRRPGIITWSADGKGLYITETDRTVGRIYILPVDGGKPRSITTGSGTYSGASFSDDGRMMAFIHQSAEASPDAYVSETKKFEPRKISNANPDFPKLRMGKTEVVTWKSKDGMTIEGLLTYPVNYEKGRKYPLILNIHGGPAGVFVQSYTGAGSIYPIQAFAQEGYAVLRPNPRGSGGYGKAFRFANVNDWGFGDYEDDMAGVEKVMEMGVAHAESLVVCGWSYGGYMTSFIVTKTNRFKAASVGAGVTNLMSFVGTADIPSFLPDYFGGEYWDRMETYARHSAMFHIKNVSTPSQVIHGEKDARVPLSQGQEFYIALKRRGVPTEMIVYPRTPHGPQEPKFIADIGERILAWFNKQLRRNGRGVIGSH